MVRGGAGGMCAIGMAVCCHDGFTTGIVNQSTCVKGGSNLRRSIYLVRLLYG